MPHIETPQDLAEWLADQIGVWGAGVRPEWVCEVTRRIREAAVNERLLQDREALERARNYFTPTPREPNYLNPHCLNDGKPCNPNGEGGCVSCDRVFSGGTSE